jgi:hypothetical protein
MISASFALIALLKYWKKRPVMVIASSAPHVQNGDGKGSKIVTFKNEEAAVAKQ